MASERGPESGELLTPEHVARLLGVGETTLRYWAQRGKGPKRLRLSYRTVRYRAEDVETWLKSRG